MNAGHTIRLHYEAVCCVCAARLPPGTTAGWDKATKQATCAPCLGLAEVDRGTAGASARAEFQRRQSNRVARIRRDHKHLGGLISPFSSDPASTTAWAVGARGEETIGKSLDALRDEGFAVLHDRRVPGSRANIDHLVIGPAGVFVVDPKNYQGRVEQRDVGGLFRTDLRLYVNGRDRTQLLTGMRRQLELVQSVLAEQCRYRDIPVTGALLFTSAENWSLLRMRPLQFHGVYVLWGKALGKLLRGSNTVPADLIPMLEHYLAASLPSHT